MQNEEINKLKLKNKVTLTIIDLFILFQVFKFNELYERISFVIKESEYESGQLFDKKMFYDIIYDIERTGLIMNHNYADIDYKGDSIVLDKNHTTIRPNDNDVYYHGRVETPMSEAYKALVISSDTRQM